MRLNRVLFAGLFLLIPLVLSSCGGSSNSNANMRIVNAFPEGAALDVTVGGQSIVRALPFQGLSGYNSVNTGSQTFTVAVSGTPTTLINTSNNTVGGNNYTYVVFGPNTAVGAVLASDSFNDPGNGFFAVRVINAAAGIGPVDIYVSGPGADINATAPVVSGVAYGVISNFISVTTGATFEVRVAPAGTKDVIYDSVPRTFSEHSGTTFVVFSKESSKLVNVINLDQNGAGTGQLANNLLTQFKVANASQVPSPLNVFLDGTLQLSNIPYTGVSNYQRVASGAHTITIEATATPGATLLTLPVTLSPATDTSIPLTGTAGALNGVVLNDDNLPPPLGTAGVRFVNTSADIAAVDVFVNFSKQVSGLATNTASTYVNFNAAITTGTNYEFDFNISGTTTVALKLPSVLLTGGHKYTVYLAGSTGSLTGIVTQDY